MRSDIQRRNVAGGIVAKFQVRRFLVVVEKDAVFQRLVDEGFAAATGSILVTAKGMPDLATRAFLQALMASAPHLVCVGGKLAQSSTMCNSIINTELLSSPK